MAAEREISPYLSKAEPLLGKQTKDLNGYSFRKA